MTFVFLQLLLLVLLLLTLGYAFLVFWELVRVARGDVPYVPSTRSAIRAVIAAQVLPKEGTIIDLGAGDGRALRLLAAAGYRGPLVGYERAPYPWMLGRLLIALQRAPVQLYRRDFRKATLEEAQGVYVFLLRDVLAELAPTLKQRLRPGTVVVSAEFPIVGWTPEQTLSARGVTAKNAGVFVYRV